MRINAFTHPFVCAEVLLGANASRESVREENARHDAVGYFHCRAPLHPGVEPLELNLLTVLMPIRSASAGFIQMLRSPKNFVGHVHMATPEQEELSLPEISTNSLERGLGGVNPGDSTQRGSPEAPLSSYFCVK